MAIQMTLGEVLEAEVALTRLAAMPWPVRTGYHISKLLRLLRVETQLFEQQRIAAVREFGTPRPATDEERARGNGEEITQVPPARMTEYLRKVTELQQLPITIDWAPLTIEAFGDQRLTGIDMLALGPLVMNGAGEGAQHG